MQRLARHPLADLLPLTPPFDARDDAALEPVAGALLSRFREHDDSEAFVFLVELCHGRLVAMAGRLARGHAIMLDPDDLVAAFMARLFTDVRKGQPRVRHFLALAYTMMRFEALNQIRSHRRSRKRCLAYGELHADQNAPADPAVLVDDQEQTEDLRRLGTVFLVVVNRCFHTLRERDRQVLTLREIEGRCYDDVAALLSVPRPQVGMILKRARERLARRIDEMFRAVQQNSEVAVLAEARHATLGRLDGRRLSRRVDHGTVSGALRLTGRSAHRDPAPAPTEPSTRLDGRA
jgi:RNA polymerase sigma factor (sigma-70 family)